MHNGVQFRAELCERIENVLQKHERAIGARIIGLVAVEAEERAKLDAATTELCDFLADAFEKAPEVVT